MESVKSCVVCGDSSEGVHFHVESCRACAAFFRRTIVMNKVYKCLHQNSCAIAKSVRCMCRDCRFKKCVAVGMNKEAVQPSRDAIGKRKFDKRRTRQVVQLENDGQQRSPPQVILPQDQPTCSNPINGSTIQSPQQSMNYLHDLQIAYRNLLERRKTTHGRQTLQGLFENDQTEIPPANIDMHIRCQRKEFGLVSEMLAACNCFRELPTDQKCILFKRFFIKFWVAERAYETLQTFGINTNRFLFANRTYADADKLEQFFANGTVAKKDPGGTARIFRNMMDHVSSIMQHMHDMNITEIELMTLLGQLLWTAGKPDVTTETIGLAKKVRDKIFVELQAYYVDNKIDNSAVRFGNLMLLIPAVQALNAVMRENFRMIKIFDMVETDTIFEELFES